MIFINQVRDKIGGPAYGASEVTPGGRALKFYSSLRLEVRKKESMKDSKTGEVFGHRCRVSVKKNKVAPPFKDCELEIYYGSGFSAEASILQEALNHKIIEKSGSWLSYGDIRLGQGSDNARKYLEENQKVREELEHLIREKSFVPSSPMLEKDDELEDDAVEDAA